MTVTIDGTTYDIGVESIKRIFPFNWKYREPTEDGKMHGELRGVYYKYRLVFTPYTDYATYSALIAKLTEETEFHTVTVPSDIGNLTFTAWFDNVSDEIWIKRGTQPYFKNLTVNFISQSPKT